MMNLDLHIRIAGDKDDLHIDFGVLLRTQEVSNIDVELIKEIKERLSSLTKDARDIAKKRGYNVLLRTAPLLVPHDHPLVLVQERHSSSLKKQSKKH